MIINGRKISERILQELKEKIQKRQLKLKLAVILVGENYASEIYIKKKKEAARKIGVKFELFKFPANIGEKELKKEIKKIAGSSEISAVIIQLPLPEKFNADKILSAIPREKDAESKSPVVSAVEEIFKEYNISLENKKIALIGKGRLVGQPIADWLKKQNLSFCGIGGIKTADVIISGAGKPKLITKDMVKKGAIVIDVGFSHDRNKKVVGDVDFKKVSQKAGLITPVPGGVGPITVACLFKNLI